LRIRNGIIKEEKGTQTEILKKDVKKILKYFKKLRKNSYKNLKK